MFSPRRAGAALALTGALVASAPAAASAATADQPAAGDPWAAATQAIANLRDAVSAVRVPDEFVYRFAHMTEASQP